MAIQMRRGLKADFDPAKMLPGEWAVAIDNDMKSQVVWMCFRAGVVKRMGTYEDFYAQIQEAGEEIKNYFIQALKETQEQLQGDTEAYIQGKVNNEWVPKLQEFVDNSSNNAAAAAKSEEAAKKAQKAAETSQEAAGASETAAGNAASMAAASEQSAKGFAANAAESETNADKWAKLSQSYAEGTAGVRDGEEMDNAEYYFEQAKRIAQGIEGALLPMGTISFSNLETAEKFPGYMYNISDAFISTGDFEDGGGKEYGAGNNVYCTAGLKWDVMAATAVTGVKGSEEPSYRQGNVDITAENVGAVSKSGATMTGNLILSGAAKVIGNVQGDADTVDGFDFIKLTKKAYSALESKNANTIYIIVG